MTKADLHPVTLMVNDKVLRLTGLVLIDYIRRACTNRFQDATNSLEMGNGSYAKDKGKAKPKGK
jgi:hypothetical protein